MNLTEKQIEDIVYNAPWVIGNNYIKSKIKGSRSEPGRQVNIGNQNSRFIDLLFKDINDGRPVIIEIKKNRIVRQDITQLLEYKSLISMFYENQRDEWESEFGYNYFSPKLIIIGKTINKEEEITATLSGIEIKVFENSDVKKLGFSSFKEMKLKVNEWNEFKNKGKTLIERGSWVSAVLENLNQTIKKINKKSKISFAEIRNISFKYSYTISESPFIDFNIKLETGTDFIGIYEYFDIEDPFNNEYVYFDLSFINFEWLKSNENFKEKLINTLENDHVAYLNSEEYCIFKLKRILFDLREEKLLSMVFSKLLLDTLKIYEDYIKITSLDEEN